MLCGDDVIANALKNGPTSAEVILHALYRKTDLHIAWAAQRNVEAHSEKLSHEGTVTQNAASEWVVSGAN